VQAAAGIPPDRLAFALRKLHASLSRLSPPLKVNLPPYTAELSVVRSLLADHAALPALKAIDRELLITTFDRLQARLDVLAPADRFVVLHGSPHSYNVLLVDNEPVFIDFETTCLGPLERDVAHLDLRAAPSFADSMHAELLWLCQSMLSVKTPTCRRAASLMRLTAAQPLAVRATHGRRRQRMRPNSTGVRRDDRRF
jgi:aminoglycoside phosphotransferase (APT) family kinase protein